LGPFDLDPCAGEPRPWDCATINYTIADDGLSQPWQGRVWLNPPFDRRVVGRWVEKLAHHRNGIALLHARTEAEWFRPVWHAAVAILFLAKRLHFYLADGTRQRANSGAPAVLVAFSSVDVEAVTRSGISGHLVTAWKGLP
jgi:hypothetical protein